MPAGRPRKPVEQRARTATGHRPLPAVTAPSVPVSEPRPVPTTPRGLATRGRREWRRIWTIGYWLKPDADAALVELVARAYDDIEAYRGQVATDGFLVVGSQGQMVHHPLLSDIRAAEAALTRWLSLLGFSPSDRARLSLAEVSKETKLEALIRRRTSSPKVVEGEVRQP